MKGPWVKRLDQGHPPGTTGPDPKSPILIQWSLSLPHSTLPLSSNSDNSHGPSYSVRYYKSACRWSISTSKACFLSVNKSKNSCTLCKYLWEYNEMDHLKCSDLVLILKILSLQEMFVIIRHINEHLQTKSNGFQNVHFQMILRCLTILYQEENPWDLKVRELLNNFQLRN